LQTLQLSRDSAYRKKVFSADTFLQFFASFIGAMRAIGALSIPVIGKALAQDSLRQRFQTPALTATACDRRIRADEDTGVAAATASAPAPGA